MGTNSIKAIDGLKELLSYIHAYDKVEEDQYAGLISEHTSAIDKN